MSSRNTARMMQPARQISAVLPIGTPKLYSLLAIWIRAMPCAYEQILLQYSARRMDSTRAFLSPVNLVVVGPLRTLLAATRSSFMDEIMRASTAEVMVWVGAPRSSAFWLVHLPVPFCPALSST